MSAETIRIVLHLDPAADPIGGSLGSDDTPARPFSGWLALGRALEHELALARREPREAPVGQVLDGFDDGHGGATR